MGWARPGCLPDLELGSDDQAFVFDGFKVEECFIFIIYSTVFGVFFNAAVEPMIFLLDPSPRSSAGTRVMSTLDVRGRQAMWSAAWWI